MTDSALSPLALAIDFGGTKIAVGAVTPDGQVVESSETPTPAGHGAEAISAALTKAAADVLAGPNGSRIAVVGVCSAGPVDVPAGTASPLNVADWRDFPLMERVASVAPGLPSTFALDGVALAAAEQAYGAAAGHRDALVITVSTGIGGGLILDGRVRTGESGNAGHIGHLVVDVNGPECACGGRGCVEAIASGTSIARWAVDNGWQGEPTTVALAEAARAGDELAIAAFDRAAHALAAAIAGTAALVDVRIAVLSGGVTQVGEVLFEPLRRHLAGHAGLSYIRDISVIPSPLRRSACLLGAARLAFAARPDLAG
ncbi:ROK family protein [Thermocrispum municipale]|uniref:ROK family protein n=1 Tax=Thermocrispum municipale TaxID=37926 RepID=UPI00041BC6C6|nr:ROK family protein [Thermocrispum municipale]